MPRRGNRLDRTMSRAKTLNLAFEVVLTENCLDGNLKGRCQSPAFKDTIDRFEQYASSRNRISNCELVKLSKMGPGSYEVLPQMKPR